MKLNDVKTSFDYLFKARITPLLIGGHGIGKTDIVREYCRDNNYFLTIINLGTQSDAGDLLGLADFITNEKGEKIATRFFIPDWVKMILDHANNNPESRAVIFLDEINRSQRIILQAVFSLLNEKRMHLTQFPSNVEIIAAMNPATTDYIVTDISDNALLDRVCQIKVTPSKQEWFEYAIKTGHNAELIAFLSQQPELLDDDSNVDFEINVKRSRRSWSGVSRLLNLELPEHLKRELITGVTGLSPAIAYEVFLQNSEKPLTVEEVIDHPDKPKLKRIIDLNRQDIISKTNEMLIAYVKSHQSISDKQYNNLKSYIYDLPREQAFSFLFQAYAFDSCFQKMNNDQEFVKYAAELRKAKV